MKIFSSIQRDLGNIVGLRHCMRGYLKILELVRALLMGPLAPRNLPLLSRLFI